MESKALAYHIKQKINLKEVHLKLNYDLVKSEHSFLLYELSKHSLAYIKDYGSVVFINCSEEEINYILTVVTDQKVNRNSYPLEEYVIKIGKDVSNFKITFAKIHVPVFDLDIAHIIMLNLAQSVALDHYYNKVEDLIQSTKPFVEQLQENGKIDLSRVKTRKLIGKTLILKNLIAENLYIFDSPNLAWSNEKLAKIDNRLKEELEIITRHKGLQQDLNVVQENLELFKDILQHKHSSTLEWIIILLIAIEIIQLIIERII